MQESTSKFGIEGCLKKKEFIPDDKMIFVFGSNEAGIMGAGAAKQAHHQFGAIWGVGFGPQGLTFAIPTKDWQIKTLPLEDVEFYIRRFVMYAHSHPNLSFKITRIGCGLAGFEDGDIVPLFNDTIVAELTNCFFDEKWKEHFDELHGEPNTYRYWGTY